MNHKEFDILAAEELRERENRLYDVHDSIEFTRQITMPLIMAISDLQNQINELKLK